MQNLIDLIRTIHPPEEEETPEDIFSSAPGLIFPDDLRNQHGEPGSIIVYKSQKYGDIELRTADPTGETERRLFGHYLWNAGILASEHVSGQRLLDNAEREKWSVKDEKVLELGAGVGLTGIVSTLSGAEETVITDFPSPEVLKNIRQNVGRAVPAGLAARVTVEGHEWGVLNDKFSTSRANTFTRVLAADCYWMPQVHLELVQSMLHFLSMDPRARIFAIAGFHTGRAKLAVFFEVAVNEGLEIEEIYEEDADGVRRPWAKERDGGQENPTERKRWLAIAILRRPNKDQL